MARLENDPIGDYKIQIEGIFKKRKIRRIEERCRECSFVCDPRLAVLGMSLNSKERKQKLADDLNEQAEVLGGEKAKDVRVLTQDDVAYCGGVIRGGRRKPQIKVVIPDKGMDVFLANRACEKVIKIRKTDER